MASYIILNVVQAELAQEDGVKEEAVDGETTGTVMVMKVSGLPVVHVQMRDSDVDVNIDTRASCSIAGAY